MIKVDTHAMEAGRDRLNYIEAWLDKVEHEIQDVTRVLRNCMDGGAITDIMMLSLRQQVQSLEKRRNRVRQMANVLQSVMEQYEKCETDAKNETLPDIFVAVKPIWDIIRPIPPAPPPRPVFVLKLEEMTTIDKYISPLITTGESAV